MISKSFRVNDIKGKKSVSSPIQDLSFNFSPKRTPIPISDKVKLVRRVEYYRQCNKESLPKDKAISLSHARDEALTPKQLVLPAKQKHDQRKMTFFSNGRARGAIKARCFSPNPKNLHLNMIKFVKRKIDCLSSERSRLVSPDKLRVKVQLMTRVNRNFKEYDFGKIKLRLPKLDGEQWNRRKGSQMPFLNNLSL
ncbi:unnamed protein product [Moneuplotes crassus]|uniref:Uncharacterized protein n=1 Tax=Euplotes crassus TaxID=5936 RepID=A0AAD1XXR8_EUPCR|nr:unnamed protein product [Moneuplotes crassus]